MSGLITGWIQDQEAKHCCYRSKIKDGKDVNCVSQRVAFIEKTPRVRINIHSIFEDKGSNEDELRYNVCGYRSWNDLKDPHIWHEGPKGSGGHAEKYEDGCDIYGYYQSSREWCDAILELLGYESDSRYRNNQTISAKQAAKKYNKEES